MGDIAQGQQVSKRLPAKQLIPYVLLVVGAVAMAVSFFLPFASAKGDYAEYLKQYGDRVYTAEAGLHNKDVVGLSLLSCPLRVMLLSIRALPPSAAKVSMGKRVCGTPACAAMWRAASNSTRWRWP